MRSDLTEGTLEAFRERIDGIDERISELFCERMRICAEIAAYKRLHSLPIENKAREDSVIAAINASQGAFRPETAKLFGAIFDISKAMQRSRLNLYLVGMPGSGKSRIGRRLARRLGRQFIDTDKLVMQRSRMSIDKIFAKRGEEGFRKTEHAALRKAAGIGASVVATGGGILTFAPNIGLLRGSGMVVFLNRSFERLLGASVRNRPLLRDNSPQTDDLANGKASADAVRKLYTERFDAYVSAADLIVDPDAPNAEAVIIKRFERFLLKG